MVFMKFLYVILIVFIGFYVGVVYLIYEIDLDIGFFDFFVLLVLLIVVGIELIIKYWKIVE